MNKSNIFGVFLALCFLLFQARAPSAHCQSEYSELVQGERFASCHNDGFEQNPSLQASVTSDLHRPSDSIPSPYEEAIKNMKAEDRDRKGLSSVQCLNSSSNSLASQAAEEGEFAQMQKCAINITNAHLGSVNIGCSAGLCHCYKREVVGDLFSNILLLLTNWISELVAGYYSEIVYTAHVLSITHILWALRHLRKY